MEDDDFFIAEREWSPDPFQERARRVLEIFFEQRRETVFFSRQIEVYHEDEFFHWITNRALRELIEEAELLRSETRQLASGGSIKLVWHRSYRYYRRSATQLVRLVEQYADPNIGGALGLHAEALVLEGFARCEFVMKGRNTRRYMDREWQDTDHDLDFIFEKDGLAYGIEVKNTLGYMDYEEFGAKIDMCRELGLRPVFAVRMLPRSWIQELRQQGGFALIFKYQLYPWGHRQLARRVAQELGLPVDSPRALAEGTMARFLRWHEQRV